ncbi:MAG: hypothetical protein ACOCP1_00405 [Campylobacterales bacterium]
MSRRFVYIFASLALFGVVLVFYIFSYFYYSEESNKYFKSEKIIAEISAIKDVYSQKDSPNALKDLIDSSGLKDFVAYDKTSSTVAEYKLEGLDPEIGWRFVKSVIQKGFSIETLEIEERDDHRFDIFLKVMF